MCASLTRRDLLKKAALGAAGAGLAGSLVRATAGAVADPQTPLPTRVLGKTGRAVTIFGLGGEALLDTPDRAQEAAALITRAIELGVTYFDTARIYGPSEEYYGQVMKDSRVRDKIFLASKVRERARDEAWRSLETTLHNLQTDRLDLVQLHNIRRQDDLEQVLGPEGAIHALTEARDQGLVRHIGITGHHDPAILAEGIRRFPFDTLLVTVNAADPHYKSMIRGVLPLARVRGLGVIAMKVLWRGNLLRNGITMQELLTYTLSQPGVTTAIVGCSSIADLEENVRIAREFAPMPAVEQAALVARTRPLAEDNCNPWQARA